MNLSTRPDCVMPAGPSPLTPDSATYMPRLPSNAMPRGAARPPTTMLIFAVGPAFSAAAPGAPTRRASAVAEAVRAAAAVRARTRRGVMVRPRPRTPAPARRAELGGTADLKATEEGGQPPNA